MKTKIKSELWGESTGGYPVVRMGSGMDLEVAGFCRMESSGLRGRRKGGKNMGRKLEINWLPRKKTVTPWRVCLKVPDLQVVRGGIGVAGPCPGGTSSVKSSNSSSEWFVAGSKTCVTVQPHRLLKEMDHRSGGHVGLHVGWLCCPEVLLMHLRLLLQLCWEDLSLKKSKKETNSLTSGSTKGSPETKRDTKCFRTAAFWRVMDLLFWSCCLPPHPREKQISITWKI